MPLSDRQDHRRHHVCLLISENKKQCSGLFLQLVNDREINLSLCWGIELGPGIADVFLMLFFSQYGRHPDSLGFD